MVEKTVYVADDGKEFESEEQCIAYEKRDIFSAAQEHIHLMDENGVECSFDNWNEFAQLIGNTDIFYMSIDNVIDKETADDIADFLHEYYGLCVSVPSCAGEYRWDDEEEKWISYEEDYERFQYNWRHRRG